MTAFNIATDVHFKVKAKTGFIIGKSPIGGYDGLATDAPLAWYDYGPAVYSIDIDRSIAVDQSLFIKPQVGTATVRIQYDTVDPMFSASLSPGYQVNIMADTNSSGGVAPVSLFNGYIDSVSTTYTPLGVTLIEVHCVDYMQKLLNTQITFSYATTDNWKTRITALYNTIATAIGYGPPNPYGPSLVFVNTTTANPNGNCTIPAYATSQTVNSGEWFTKWLDAEGATAWITGDGYLQICARDYGTPYVTVPVATDDINYTSESTIMYSDINLTYDAKDALNSLIVSSSATTGVTTAYKKNQASIDLYGEFAQQVSLDVWGTNDAINWANDITLYDASRRVESITYPQIRPLNGEMRVRYYILGIDLTQKVTVNYTAPVSGYTFSATNMVTRVQHSITTDNWITTLELWKGV